MKLNVFVGLLLSPLFSLAASPAIYKATTIAPAEFRTISVDWISLYKTEEHSLRGERMDLGSTNVLFNGLYKISDIRYNAADKHEYFTGEKVLVNKWDSGCGYGYRATATVVARQPIAGFSGTIKNNLKIRVKILDTNDTCHSDPSVTVIEYKLAK